MTEWVLIVLFPVVNRRWVPNMEEELRLVDEGVQKIVREFSSTLSYDFAVLHGSRLEAFQTSVLQIPEAMEIIFGDFEHYKELSDRVYDREPQHVFLENFKQSAKNFLQNVHKVILESIIEYKKCGILNPSSLVDWKAVVLVFRLRLDAFHATCGPNQDSADETMCKDQTQARILPNGEEDAVVLALNTIGSVIRSQGDEIRRLRDRFASLEANTQTKQVPKLSRLGP